MILPLNLTMISLPVELFLALRYLKPRRTFVSVITILSILGVTLGVMVMIVVLSVMEGYQRELEKKIIGFNAHIVLSNRGILYDSPEILEDLTKIPEIQTASPFAQGPVLADFRGRITTPVIKGISSETNHALLSLQDKIIVGEYDLTGNSLLVGEEWAKRNGALIGDKILVYAPRHLKAIQQARQGYRAPDVVMLPNEYVIQGIFRTGLYEYDVNFFLTSLFNFQQLYELREGVHGINIQMANPDPSYVFPLTQALNKKYSGPLQARSWMDLNRPLFEAVAIERVVMAFLLFFVCVVAGFGVATTLITITVQKSREIGVLKAMGAQKKQILMVFALYGLIVGVLGASIGSSLGLLVLSYRNTARNFLLHTFDLDVFSPEIYNFPELPAVVHPSTVLCTFLAGVSICILAALLPARHASNLDPARALRYE